MKSRVGQGCSSTDLHIEAWRFWGSKSHHTITGPLLLRTVVLFLSTGRP